jgi:small subunit ribosomal protein S7
MPPVGGAPGGAATGAREGRRVPRRGTIQKREIAADPVYHSVLVARLVNKMMQHGKKGLAQRLVYEAFDEIAAKSERNPLEVFETAMRNISPTLEVRPRRVGGATLQVPSEVRPERRTSLALRWLVQFTRRRNERASSARLAGEILDASNNTGASVRQKEDLHRMAEANRAFAHYRW